MTDSQPDNRPSGTQNPQQPQVPSGNPFFSWLRSLGIRRSTDRWGGGVCAGLAARIGWEPLLVRIIWFVVGLMAGLGVALYGIAWLLLPDERDGRILAESATQGEIRAPFIISVIMIALGLTSSTLLPPHYFGVSLIIIVAVLAGVASWGHGYGGRGRADEGTRPSAFEQRAGHFDSMPFPANGPAPAQAADDGTNSSAPLSPDRYHPGATGSAGRPAGQWGPAPGGPGPAWNANRPAGPDSRGNNAYPQDGYGRYQPPYEQGYSWHYDSRRASRTYLPRKTPSPVLVGIITGLYFLSAAAAVVAHLVFPTLSGWVIFALWSLGWAMLLGLLMIFLGIAGRRPGKIAPLIVFTFIFALFSTGMTHLDLVHSGRSLPDGQTVFSSISYSTQDMSRLRSGVTAVGSSMTIDLTNWPAGNSHHHEDSATCPTGTIRVNAVMSTVKILLPPGCGWTESGLTTVMTQGPQHLDSSDAPEAPDGVLNLAGRTVMSNVIIDN